MDRVCIIVLIVIAAMFLLLFLIFYPFKIEINSFIDLTRLESAVSLKISFFKKFDFKIKIKNGKLWLCRKSCQEIPINVAEIITGEKYFDIFIKNLIMHIKIKKLYFFISTCIKENLYYNILLSAFINILNNATSSIIFTNTDIYYYADVTMEYERNMLEITENCIIRTSIANIINIAIKSLTQMIKRRIIIKPKSV